MYENVVWLEEKISETMRKLNNRANEKLFVKLGKLILMRKNYVSDPLGEKIRVMESFLGFVDDGALLLEMKPVVERFLRDEVR